MMLEIGTVYMRCRTTHHRCTEAFPRKYLSPRTLFIKSEGHLFQIKQVVIFNLKYISTSYTFYYKYYKYYNI